MKKFYTVIIIGSLGIVGCLWALSFAADTIITDKKALSDLDFIFAKQEYYKMSKTSLYLSHRRATLQLIESLGDVKISDSIEGLDFMKTKESFSVYISKNLSLTKFKDVNEAIKLRDLCIDLNHQMIKENEKLFELIKGASVEQLIEILEPDQLDFFGN